MNAQLDIKSLRLKVEKYLKLISDHAVFAAVLFVLLTYIFMVWQISKLSTAEPSGEAVSAASTQIPKIDQQAITQIQNLEQNNTDAHSLFNQARNNPFQE